MDVNILILALAALIVGARAQSVAKYSLNFESKSTPCDNKNVRFDIKNGACDNKIGPCDIRNGPCDCKIGPCDIRNGPCDNTNGPFLQSATNQITSCDNVAVSETRVPRGSSVTFPTTMKPPSMPNRNINFASTECDRLPTPTCGSVEATRPSLFSRNINYIPSVSECDTTSRTFTPCNSVTETVGPSIPFMNQNINSASSILECETKSASSCNSITQNFIPLNSFLNRPECDTNCISNWNSVTETTRPSNLFLNGNLNCATSESINCNSITDASANSFRNRLLPFSNTISESVTSSNCGTKLPQSATTGIWKSPLMLSGNACNEPLPYSCNTETKISQLCATSLADSISSRSLNRFFNGPSILPCVENTETVSTRTSCIDSPGTYDRVLNRPIFEVYPPVSNLPCVDKIRPSNFIIETSSTPCGNDIGSCSCNLPFNRPVFEALPVHNLPCIEINKRPLTENNFQIVNRQQCVDNRPSCNSITDIPSNRPVLETFPVNNKQNVVCGVSKSCDTVDNVNSFITRLPNNPFNRQCLETTSCNINSGCNCNSCANFNPCLQQRFTPFQAPILPSVDTQILPNCATTSVVDSSVVNSLTDSIQLLVVANLIQNSMYLNSLSGNPCLNTDVLGSVQCVLDNAPACGCTDVVDACGNTGVDVNCCNNISPCNTCLQENCGACYPNCGNFGCQGYPDVITSILNNRGKPLPDVLSLLGYPCFGDFGGQFDCSPLTNNQFGGCSTLPEVVTPFGGCSGVADVSLGGFSGCHNLPQWSASCRGNFYNIPDEIFPQFAPQSFQGCNSCGFDGCSYLPFDSFGLCNCASDFQPFQLPYQQESCCFQNGIGYGSADVSTCGLFSGIPDIQSLPQIYNPYVPETMLPCFSDLPNVQLLPNYSCNELPVGCNTFNNLQEMSTQNLIHLPEAISCNQNDNFAYQSISNPFANLNVQQNVLVPQIFGLQEQISCIEVAPNSYNVQEYITPVAQSYITQSCQNDIPVIPAYFVPELTDCSNNYVPEVTVSTCNPGINYNSYEYPVELCLQQNVDLGYALELPTQAEILIPSSMPAELWIDPASLPTVYLSIDPTFGQSFGC